MSQLLLEGDIVICRYGYMTKEYVEFKVNRIEKMYIHISPAKYTWNPNMVFDPRREYACKKVMTCANYPWHWYKWEELDLPSGDELLQELGWLGLHVNLHKIIVGYLVADK